MADALPEPLEMEQLPIELRQELSGSHYATEQSNLISPVDRTMHHLDFKYSSSLTHHNPSYQQQADQPVASTHIVGNNNNTPHLSHNQSYPSNSPSPQSPSPRLHNSVTEEGSVSHPFKSNEDSELDKEYEFAMNPQPVAKNSNSFRDLSNISLISVTKSPGYEAMDVDPLPVSTNGQLSIASKQPETTSSPMNSSSDSKSDLGVYNPYEQPRQSSDSASTVHPPSNLKNISVPKTLADQNSLKAPSQGLQRHTVDRNARDETIRLERLMSPDDEQDSLLDPSQGVTSLMDMIQLVQLTKTEKSTKTRMVILQKIIQTDDIALLQKFVHHEERIGIRTLGNWLYSYYDKRMMRITLNILKALDKLPTYASDLRHLKIQGVVRLIATMSAGRDDPPDVTTAVTNLDTKWERTHHYQPTKEEAVNLEAALAESRANMEARNTMQTHEQESKSSSMGNKGNDGGESKADSLKRPHKSTEQDLKPNVKRVKPGATKESGTTKAKAVTDTDFFNRLLGPKRPQAPEPSKPKVIQSSSEAKVSTFNANELKKAKTVGRTIPQGKGSDFSLDALLSTIERSPEQKRSSESPSKSPSPTANNLKSPEVASSDSASTTRKRAVTFAPDDRIAEYRYYTPNAEEWADQPAGEAINHEHGNARDLDVGEGRMAFERTHPHQASDSPKDWYPPHPIRLPDNLVNAIPEETAESKAQAIREESTFAAVYTSLTHIPPSPAEPTEAPPEHPDANVLHIPLEDMYSYQVNIDRANAPPPPPPTDPAAMNKLIAAAGSVLQSINGVPQAHIPLQAPAAPPPTNTKSSVDLSLVGGLLNNPSLVQSLLGLMGSNTNSSSNPVTSSPPTNTVPTGPSVSVVSSNTWQEQSHATSPPPPPPQQPPRQPYNYYQSSSPQQYQSPNRNQQYGNSQPYPDQSYSAPGQPTPTARGHYSASGPIPTGPSQRPAINPNFRGGFRGGGARGASRGGRGKGPRGGRGNKFRGSPNRF